MTYDFNTLKQTVGEATSRPTFYTDFDDVPTDKLHQISELTEWIRTKSKGSDIREIIAQLFERTWLENVREGNSNMEVSQARGNFNELAKRLNNLDAVVESKADLNEITTRLKNLASVSPKGTYANLSTLQQAHPNGDSGTYITTDNKNWNYWNGSAWVSGGIYQSSAVSPFETFAFIAGDKPINFNNASKLIEITGNNTYLLQGRVYAISKGNVAYPSSSAWVVVDTITKRLKTAPNPTATDIVVGAIFNPDTPTPIVTFNGIYTIDGLHPLTSPEVIPFSQYTLFTNNNNIVYDKKRKVLKFPQTNVVLGSKENWVQAQELQLTGQAGHILFNTITNSFEIGEANRKSLVNVVGYYHNDREQIHLNTNTLNTRMKKIACLGDSITEGVNANGWQWHRYIDKWCKNNGTETTIVNLGIGGTSVCTSSYVTDTLKPFVNRIATIPVDADVAIIFGGTNDWGNNATLGTISDTGTETFYGAYKYMLEWLAVNRPNTKVLTVTPLKRYFRGGGTTWHNAQTTPNNKGQLLQDYVRAVKEVSNMYGIPCVDLHNESGLNPEIEVVRNKFIPDGLHPNEVGSEKIYGVILDKLRPLIEY